MREIKIIRSDCKDCKFVRECGDIFEVEGQCPSNNGGEKWASYQKENYSY
uniref:Uncharacterized protein n=1 Tax=viral metagenome TaxID=1070528 RepID=A0A6M3K2F4_9ZZZZ